MLRGRFIFTLALFIISVISLIFTLAYPYKSRIFPLIALSTALFLLVIEIVKEFSTAREKGGVEKEEAESFGPKHLAIWAWMVGTVLMLWILGFMGTVVLLPFLYLRFQRESWLLSITISIGCLVFFYGLFNVGLKMPLYPGLLYSKIFG
ncbi:MAG: tripartite tricarboxylate transporter TctB family protein [Thermodesulfobacteriota bacterium]|nr:tripartite tricarboxylate transporter TctB family protein [Thermodesulfobacteriota bacterium]